MIVTNGSFEATKTVFSRSGRPCRLPSVSLSEERLAEHPSLLVLAILGEHKRMRRHRSDERGDLLDAISPAVSNIHRD